MAKHDLSQVLFRISNCAAVRLFKKERTKQLSVKQFFDSSDQMTAPRATITDKPLHLRTQ